jgi:hypothetical protein
MNQSIEQTITHVIPAYVSADETQPVGILITGDAWSVQKATELINAAPKIYTALGDLLQAVYQANSPRWRDEINAALLDAQRAEAAACGAVLARDRMVQHGS